MALGKTRCFGCYVVIHPTFKFCSKSHAVCPYCHQHTNIETGEAGEIDDCLDTERDSKLEIKELEKFFLMESYCQFSCGFWGNASVLYNHEKDCYMRGTPMKCLIKNCKWRGSNYEIIKHVQRRHPEQLANLSEMNDEFIVLLSESAILITEFSGDSNVNQLYWLQIYEENNSRYIVIKDHGPIGQYATPEQKFTSYSISSVANNECYITSFVVEADNESTDDTETRTCISCFKDDYYKVKILRNTTNLLPDSMKVSLKCTNCSELLLGRIRQCKAGHSFCVNCTKTLAPCSECKQKIDNTRNFSLENFVANVKLGCKYRNQGCVLALRAEDLEKHVKNCLYATTECASIHCKWSGLFKNFLRHLMCEHDVVTDGIVFPIRIRDEYLVRLTFYRFASNTFAFAYKMTTHLQFMVYHITNEENSDFSFKVKFTDSDQDSLVTFSKRCLAATPGYLRNFALCERTDGNESSRVHKDICHHHTSDRNGYLKYDIEFTRKYPYNSRTGSNLSLVMDS